MKKYSKRVVFDYVYGNDIPDFDIEFLENDPDFMMQAIQLSNDKNLYYLCGDFVKNNYAFIRFIVKKFGSDIPFITEVANVYINSNDYENTELEHNELCAILRKLIGPTMNPDYISYRLACESFYLITISSLGAQVEENGEDLPKDFGLGFSAIQIMYEEYPDLVEFMAEKLIEEILENNDRYSLEEILHKMTNDFDRISCEGINSFLTKYISQFDGNLAWYISCKPELLETYKKDLAKITKRWDTFVKKTNSQKIDIFIQELEQYFEENNSKYVTFTCTQLVLYILKKLNLEEMIKYNECFMDFMTSSYGLFEQRLSQRIKKEDLTFDEIKFVKYAEKLAKEIFGSNIIETNDEDNNFKSEKNRILGTF